MRGKVDGRDRQYHIEYNGKDFKRDISMLIPEERMKEIDVNRHDPKTVYEIHSGDWSSDVCSSDLFTSHCGGAVVVGEVFGFATPSGNFLLAEWGACRSRHGLLC